MTDEAQELRARVLLGKYEQTILSEIENKKKVAAYGQCIEETRPNAITQKSSAVTKAVVSERLKQSFIIELQNLEFNHVEVELKEVGGAEGVFYHKLILTRNPGIEVPKVVSEGEQRCISIAAFFAELSTADDPSAIVFDDPVSSLDFEWRNNVAKRLVEESKRRQVIVFTHDVVFLLAMKQFAAQSSIRALDQHVRRQSKGAGVCVEELPWVAMPVKGKIGYLKNRWQAADKLCPRRASRRLRTGGEVSLRPIARSMGTCPRRGSPGRGSGAVQAKRSDAKACPTCRHYGRRLQNG